MQRGKKMKKYNYKEPAEKYEKHRVVEISPVDRVTAVYSEDVWSKQAFSQEK